MITDQEKKVLELTGDTWNEFLKLPVINTDDTTDFRYHIHAMQNMILSRSAQRLMAEIEDALKNNLPTINK